MAKYEFAVIGAGVFGAWLARALHLRGRRVVLIDQYGPANSRASSGGETRILRMGYGAKEIYTRWSWRALQLYKDFYGATDPTLIQTTGILWLCLPGEQSALDTLTTFANCAIPHAILTAADIALKCPQFQITPETWGIWEPDAAVLLARRGVQTVVRESVRAGLEFRQETYEKANIQADTYIYACGPWMPKLFPDLLGDKIRPTRQEVLYFGTPPGGLKLPCWVDSAAGMYGIPDIENRGFKVAIDKHGPAVDPDTHSRLVAQQTVDQVRLYLAERFPNLSDAPLVQTEVCQYENTANGDYLIDRHPAHDNVWLLGGGSGHGYKHGPVIGEYLANALINGAPIDRIFSLAAKAPYATGTRTSTI
ncbi:MAG: FAD-dependent oxidoreductase [Bryobacteraceae bacterium]